MVLKAAFHFYLKNLTAGIFIINVILQLFRISSGVVEG